MQTGREREIKRERSTVGESVREREKKERDSMRLIEMKTEMKKLGEKK